MSCAFRVQDYPPLWRSRVVGWARAASYRCPAEWTLIPPHRRDLKIMRNIKPNPFARGAVADDGRVAMHRSRSLLGFSLGSRGASGQMRRSNGSGGYATDLGHGGALLPLMSGKACRSRPLDTLWRWSKG